jgi:hypothetical protein
MEKHFSNKNKSLKVARETGYGLREDTLLTGVNIGDQIL